jgi:glycosyltransferase involved in cell wall biosynthesis
VLVGIPAFNEERSIARVITQAQCFADEVLVCDDGSTDSTWREASKMGAIVVRHENNLGYGAALATIFREAAKRKLQVLVTMDADGQHDARDIPKLTAPIRIGRAQVVLGSRLLRSSYRDLGYRGVGVEIFTRITNFMTEQEFSDVQSGFRSYSPEAVRTVLPNETGMGASLEILLRAVCARLPIAEVPVTINHRISSRKNYQYKPVEHALELIFALTRTLIRTHPRNFQRSMG